jgi:rhamnosyltransferase
VCCIIVTYQPDRALLERVLTAIRPQVGHCLIVDNGSDAASIAWMKTRDELVEVIEMGDNVGLGAAQNRGIVRARTGGFSHELFLDQDSIPCSHMVRNLMAAFTYLNHHNGSAAAVGPRTLDARTGEPFPFIRFSPLSVRRSICHPPLAGKYIPTDFLISSGMLVSLAVFERVGMMDEDLFIDNVDLEWCFRSRSLGFSLYGVCDAALEHSLGDNVIQLRLLGRWVHIFLHSEERQYYIMRNRISLYRRSYTPLGWITQDILRMAFKSMYLVIFQPQRLENTRMILSGIRDGLLGKKGKKFS